MMRLRRNCREDEIIDSTISLDQGQSIELFIRSYKKYGGNAGIIVKKGDRLKFRVARFQYWIDLIIPCGANGFVNPLVTNKNARVKNTKCFYLCGVIRGDEEIYFKIGKRRTVEITQDGLLYFFPNDDPGFYCNNSGSIKLKINKISA